MLVRKLVSDWAEPRWALPARGKDGEEGEIIEEGDGDGDGEAW